MSTTTIIIFAAVFLSGIALGALIIWGISRRRKTVSAPEKPPDMAKSIPVNEQATPVILPSPLVFRWSYVAAPIILTVVCLIIALSFATFLPSPLGYRFSGDGTARMSMNTYTFIVLMIAAQFICALSAWGIARVIIKMGHAAFKAAPPQVPLDAYISLMTNMVLLPQLILAYIMLDAFIYGVWTRHLISVGLFSILIIAIGSLTLIFIFMHLLSRTNNVISKQ